jgi:predicted RNA-binding protein YlqC (UPF0109 family)
VASHAAAVVEVIARALVDAPDAVKVTEHPHRGTTLIELTVAQADAGKVIGRQGRIAEALRTMVATTAHHQGEKAVLEIRDAD